MIIVIFTAKLEVWNAKLTRMWQKFYIQEETLQVCDVNSLHCATLLYLSSLTIRCMLSCSVEFNSATPWTVALQSLHPWDFPGKNTRMVAISSSKGSFQPRNRTHISCIGRQILYHRATWEGIMAVGFKLLALETNDLDLNPSSTTVWPWEASSFLQASDTSSVKWE